MKKKPIIKSLSVCAAIVIVAIAGYTAYRYYRLMYSNLHAKDNAHHEVFIYPDTNIDTLLNHIHQLYDIDSEHALQSDIKRLKLTELKTGHYTIPAQCANYQLIQMFKFGQQTPVRLTFNNIRTIEQLSSKLSRQLLADSLAFDTMLRDTAFLAAHGLTPPTAMMYFLPNSYEVYWNTSAERIFERMQNEYKHFWNEKRREKAEELGLTAFEISTLASIVEEENTGHPDEWNRIAGVYLNRLQRNIPLQADPTVKYAVGDFTLRRVLTKHLQTNSPYNTYMVTGLPPGPIRLPSPRGIDAVLNAEKHDYLFMCADWRFNGYHVFATTSAQHARNAHRYQQELNKRRIYK